MKKEKRLLAAIVLSASLGLALSACEGDRSPGDPAGQPRRDTAPATPSPGPGPGQPAK